MSAGVSQYSLAKQLPVTQGALSKLLARTRERSEASKLPLWDPYLYETEVGRGGQDIDFSPEQKAAIIAIATQNKEAREKQSWQAVADGDFDHLQLPRPLSVSSFENIMYEAGYGRKAPGRKPMLDNAQKKRRLEWVLAHNPDLYKYGNGLGFNFQRVIFTDETPARFYGSFTYDAKGPYHIYGTETPEAKKLAKQAYDEENQRNKEQRQQLVPRTRAVLRELGDADANSRAWAWAKHHEMKRGDRSRGDIDGYRHREEVLKPLLVP
ncbi:hypothetical protein BU23DRAFT_640831 [Bimuria novae-zelandiae CBS 107.79]|uniref:Transposase Tc1-like domain-containing protein n=1 Tax=Bimuria novae-zelandiae CBS 107.79 TaxID=1447943 RepID=A0A6A5V7Q9_9PLEO|nr:hypothetical protein BU23DRAFT_640831 [Bimuria novae-zelandiae CBS 107.79]